MFVLTRNSLVGIVSRDAKFLLKFHDNIRNLRNFATKLSNGKESRPRLVSEKQQAKHFVDFKRIRATGGDGGDGCSSFLSIFGKEFAGPDGGNGGNGGHIVFQADPNVVTLSKIYPIYKGKEGERGQGKHCNGKNAETTFVKVPVGTFFRNEDADIVGDLKNPGEILIAARGGAGGKGNYFFLSNDNRAPTTYEKGGEGEMKVIYAELRIIAHVGLVGLPNAGKSSLLRCLTRARPQIGYYPFTTIFPHVGVMEYDDYEQVFVADIPGLIEGAHMNRGLGFSFLRHVEQCRSIIYLIDLSYNNVVWQLNMLKNELEHYKEGLSEKRHIIVGNKIDLEMSGRNLDLLTEELKDHNVTILPISAKKKTNIDELITLIRQLYNIDSNDNNTATNN